MTVDIPELDVSLVNLSNAIYNYFLVIYEQIMNQQGTDGNIQNEFLIFPFYYPDYQKK